MLYNDSAVINIFLNLDNSRSQCFPLNLCLSSNSPAQLMLIKQFPCTTHAYQAIPQHNSCLSSNFPAQHMLIKQFPRTTHAYQAILPHNSCLSCNSPSQRMLIKKFTSQLMLIKQFPLTTHAYQAIPSDNACLSTNSSSSFSSLITKTRQTNLKIPLQVLHKNILPHFNHSRKKTFMQLEETFFNYNYRNVLHTGFGFWN